uniref:Uncharacterized protein n=1 Tax=Parascaris univalens TaxID=6257 RepID=A0A914ZZX7_PARUN
MIQRGTKRNTFKKTKDANHTRVSTAGLISFWCILCGFHSLPIGCRTTAS